MAPRRIIRLSPAKKPVPATRRPKKKLKKNPVLVTRCASFWSLAPKNLDIRLEAPVPTKKPSAFNIIGIENTTPTAPVALVPSLPTKNVSARLYTLLISIVTMLGSASDRINPNTGAVVIFSYWSCFAL